MDSPNAESSILFSSQSLEHPRMSLDSCGEGMQLKAEGFPTGSALTELVPSAFHSKLKVPWKTCVGHSRNNGFLPFNDE